MDPVQPPKPGRPAASVGDNDLVWEDKGDASLTGEHRAYEAPAATGIYSLSPASGFPDMKFEGYDVVHIKNPTAHYGEQRRRLIKDGVKTAEEARAIAQADHDRGGDA
ncbi:MAG TPA: hypothetical protein VH678_16725 [Xanthobacteraceae bacterium]|jgi:hypothetical protein